MATEYIAVAFTILFTVATSIPLGRYMARVFSGERTIIIALIPLALRGISYKPLGAAAILRRNMLIYGVGGVILPFIGIKALDVLLVALRLA